MERNSLKSIFFRSEEFTFKEVSSLSGLESEDFEKTTKQFYFEKTYERLNKFYKQNGILDKEDKINGVVVPSVNDLIKQIDKDWLCSKKFYQFHGDFILDNIIETDKGFCLIDWRQDFAGNLDVGDIYYDLAKLNHNLTINHDIVNKNLFSSNPNNCYILTNSKLNECREILYKFILDEGLDLNKVKILTAIIWINMAPLHEYPLNNFLFNFGKYTLNYLYE